ncbi:hypothetical protein H8A99_00280 [Bradyrhizobium sp. Arg68]|uniref:hypothetical protein n=1 Tax=Bradyrhizobium ivorense TaxID=2511166 RepID=UPI001E652395|nr:hypothetical protein [Bradyrhizobium ivorense]MCC8934974.1 hypothetical protein [Bradyrhizobium ivorense]
MMTTPHRLATQLVGLQAGRGMSPKARQNISLARVNARSGRPASMLRRVIRIDRYSMPQ